MPATRPIVTLPETPAAAAPTLEPTPEAARSYRVVAGGDVLPAHHLDAYNKRYGFTYPFQKIQAHFQAADIGLVNLECPLSGQGKKLKGKKFTFRGKPEAAFGLKQAGINAVAMANNHMMDFGAPALADTLKALDAAGVVHAGAGMSGREAHAAGKLTLADGTQAALLSYTLTFPSSFWAAGRKPGTALARMETMQAEIAAAKAWAKLVIVCFHWGSELKNDPSPYQTEYGHAAIRAGAQLVVGTHPHVLQGLEWYQGGLIIYSLGNLAFGGNMSKQAVTSGLVEVEFDGDGKITAAKVLPLSVDNRLTRFIPTPVGGDQANTIFRFLQTHSLPWNTRIVADGSGWGQILEPERPVENASRAVLPNP